MPRADSKRWICRSTSASRLPPLVSEPIEDRWLRQLVRDEPALPAHRSKLDDSAPRLPDVAGLHTIGMKMADAEKYLTKDVFVAGAAQQITCNRRDEGHLEDELGLHLGPRCRAACPPC